MTDGENWAKDIKRQFAKTVPMMNNYMENV